MNPPPTLASPPPAPPVEPTFLLAVRGIWLLTWKSQLAWRRLPVGIISLLALPLVVYITTSPFVWSQRHDLLGSPNQRFEELSRRLGRGGIPLRPEQTIPVRQIFTEEFAQTERESNQNQSPETGPGRRAERVRECYERISERMRNVLDERQFSRYKSLESRLLLESERRPNEPFWTRSGAFYHWLIDFYFFVMLPLNCVRMCGALIRDDLQADTLGFLTTRPLSRARLLLVKYLSQTAWLELLMALETVLLFGVGILRQIPALTGLFPLLLATQFLAVLAWCALGTFLGLVSTRYMAMAIVYGLIIEMGIGRIPTNINALSLMRHLKVLLAHNAALREVYDWSSAGTVLSVGALMVAVGIFLTLATLLFTFREYHHTAEMQK